jgi:hypothetical protein
MGESGDMAAAVEERGRGESGRPFRTRGNLTTPKGDCVDAE